MTIDNIKIFPSIGIARLGNSETEFFIGPEFPGDHPIPKGGYKDSNLNIKRQAARFHLFGYEAGSTDAKEITLIDADIKWTVQLANTKADWFMFSNPEECRNKEVKGADRASLRITPKAQTLDSTENTTTKSFDNGTFAIKDQSVGVPLGEIQIESDGHLLVLGGFGNSGSLNTEKKIKNFADNDGWYDDVSDGPVKASVRFKGTSTWVEASPAWVICAPPKFVPPIPHIITLYDALLQKAKERNPMLPGTEKLLPPDIPSFTMDIYPILSRAMNIKWISRLTGVMHKKVQVAMPLPGPDTPEQKIARNKVFSRIRDPTTPDDLVIGEQDMPYVWSEAYDKANRVNQALTEIQFHILEQWAKGNFDKNPATPETRITPEGLNRAALENCVGAPLYPGIETSKLTRDNYPFIEIFRLDATLRKPGDLTKQMAVPWQADFFECGYDDFETGDGKGLFWWPMHHPTAVYPSSGEDQRNWNEMTIVDEFVEKWHTLGFVIQQGDRYVETQRST